MKSPDDLMPQTNNHAPCALVVEDERLIRMFVCSTLEDAGFRTLEAGDSEEALGVLQTHGQDIVLLFTDVAMPGTENGLALAQRCAARWPGIAIIIASGQSLPKPLQLPPGAAFISKPFMADHVHEALSSLLQLK